ncbi:hypothetical protein HDU97_002461 [Phlyctochytrium planicorne]|nr:hypothetical protein HDU97_002461 [Phlyctochytrium planicorne]
MTTLQQPSIVLETDDGPHAVNESSDQTATKTGDETPVPGDNPSSSENDGSTPAPQTFQPHESEQSGGAQPAASGIGSHAAPDMQTSGLAPDASRESRILARKQRIESNRLARMKPDKSDENAARRKPKVEAETKDNGKAKSQISTSNKRIEMTKQSTTDLTTNVRVGILARETVRRFEENKKVDIWTHKRRDEEERSDAMRNEIKAHWDKVLELKGPYELNEALLKQKDACDGFMGSKNRLINEYMTELKTKDDEYVKELKRQAEEIDTLLERMESQYKIVQTTLKDELEQIEKAFIEERSELFESNLKDVETFLQQRRNNEAKYMEERAERIEDHIKQLELLRVRDAEEYNLVKIKLETDVQVLEQQLQQMRATYQLNTEKLEYNFQVLKKREEENGTILSTQKRKITRLTDHLNMLKAKIAKQEKSFQQEYVSLTDDYKRITEQFKELQKKFRHFRSSDNKKYQEIWRMNEEMTKELMRKVLQADRIIYEQQLGLKWTPPKDEALLESSPLGNHVAHEGDDEPSMEIAATITAEGVFSGGNGAVADMGTLPTTASEKKESLASKFKDHNRYSKNMKRMLELLCNEAGFLVEDKLQKLLAPLHRDEQSLMKLDSIFKALHIETVEDIEKLTSYFVARGTSPVPVVEGEDVKNEAPNGDGEQKDAVAETDASSPSASAPLLPVTSQQQQQNSGHHEDAAESTLIHPNDVIKSIRRFVEDQRAERINDMSKRKSKAFDMGGAFFDLKGEEEVEGEEDADGASQVKTSKTKSELQKEYWDKMANILDDKSYRIWTAVYAAMEKYNDLLSQRWQETQEIGSIMQQNEELKGLLRQYMSAKVNDELQVPPTQIMLAQLHKDKRMISLRDHVLCTTKELALHVMTFIESLRELDAFVKAFLPLQPLLTGQIAYEKFNGASPHLTLLRLSEMRYNAYDYLHPRIRIETVARCIEEIKKEGSMNRLEFGLLMHPLYFHIAEKIVVENPAFAIKSAKHASRHLSKLSVKQLIKIVEWNVFSDSHVLAVSIYPDREDVARRIVELRNPEVTEEVMQHAILAAAAGNRKWLDEFLGRGVSPLPVLQDVVKHPTLLLELIRWCRNKEGGGRLPGILMVDLLGTCIHWNHLEAMRIVMENSDFSVQNIRTAYVACEMETDLFGRSPVLDGVDESFVMDAAVGRGHLVVVELLVKLGCFVRDGNLKVALQKGYVNVVKFIAADGGREGREWDEPTRKRVVLDWWNDGGRESQAVEELLREWQML